MRQFNKNTNFTFSDYTTYGLGGRAEQAFFPETIEEAKEVFDFVRQNFKKYVILGNGSNVLASDKFYDGAVICTKNLSYVTYENGVLTCLGGTKVSALLKFCKQNALSGLEYLAGIPATVGGLAFMNGGINSRHIGDDIISVTVYDGKTSVLSNKKCNFGNKHSTMRDINAIILGVELKVVQMSKKEEVAQNIEKVLKSRSSIPNGKSCGCVFKNPKGLSAGKLIDVAGLKGLKCGNAEVSSEHANFIINNGATADEVYNLIHTVKSKVSAEFGVELEDEVVYIGEFNDFNG